MFFLILEKEEGREKGRDGERGEKERGRNIYGLPPIRALMGEGT